MRITARLESADRLLLAVENSGSWVEPDPATSTSTGVMNLRRRLHLIYQSEASLSLNRSEMGVIAQISLPMRTLL